MQAFQQWQQSPSQGAIPPQPQPTDWERQAMCDDLTTAQMFLQAAYDAAAKAKLKDTHYELNGAIADALNSCNEAVQRLTDAPDQ
jgi:hypothetical protein